MPPLPPPPHPLMYLPVWRPPQLLLPSTLRLHRAVGSQEARVVVMAQQVRSSHSGRTQIAQLRGLAGLGSRGAPKWRLPEVRPSPAPPPPPRQPPDALRVQWAGARPNWGRGAGRLAWAAVGGAGAWWHWRRGWRRGWRRLAALEG